MSIIVAPGPLLLLLRDRHALPGEPHSGSEDRGGDSGLPGRGLADVPERGRPFCGLRGQAAVLQGLLRRGIPHGGPRRRAPLGFLQGGEGLGPPPATGWIFMTIVRRL